MRFKNIQNTITKIVEILVYTHTNIYFCSYGKV